ncbi:MAG: response regulator transcription factor [Dermatophilus congolensis]|nr:response regulator transcription factor [Dermatophilus congolensis]
MSRFLVVDDEETLASFIVRGLAKQGYTAESEWSGEAAVELALSGECDLVLLDVGLPDIDGFEVLTRIRRRGGTVPIIMLTARTAVPDRVAALQGGADDYVPKPFSFDELLARIRLRLRDVRQPAASVLERNGVTIDLLGHRVEVNGKEVDLSPREFALAETFMRNAGHVLSRQQLLDGVWGYDFDPGSNVVDVYVRYLRAKLGKDRIETVRGMGYRML